MNESQHEKLRERAIRREGELLLEMEAEAGKRPGKAMVPAPREPIPGIRVRSARAAVVKAGILP